MKDAMKKIEIIVKGNQLQAIQELLDRTEVSGIHHHFKHIRKRASRVTPRPADVQRV